MTISNFDRNVSNNARNLVIAIMTTIVVLIWLCFPPANKLWQICSWGNNVCLFLSKSFKPNWEYLYIRNNAIFHIKMFPKEKKEGLAILDNAIDVASKKSSQKTVNQLYKDKAVIQMYYNDYAEALDNYLRTKDIQYNDYLNVALLYNAIGKYDSAASYCNEIINHENNSYAGYSCLTYVYRSMNQSTNALKLWDIALSDKKTNPQMYVERGNIRKQLGDAKGADSDFARAKTLNSMVKLNYSLAEETIHPKTLKLPIKLFE